MIEYTDKAKVLVQRMKLDEEELRELENWVVQNHFKIGDRHINEWLYVKHNENLTKNQ